MRNRNYSLLIDLPQTGDTITINPPLRVSFAIHKASEGAGLNRATIKIYNLPPAVREKLLRGPADTLNCIRVTLSAGYDDAMNVLVKSNVQRGYVERNDADIVSVLECLDIGFYNCKDEAKWYSAAVVGKEAAINAVTNNLMDKGAVTKQDQLTRPKIIFGDLPVCLDSLLGHDETWNIDDGQLFIKKANGEVVGDFIPVIMPETGLLSVPTRDGNKVELETLINPAIRVGSRAEVRSSLSSFVNGKGKVIAIETRGDIDSDQWTQYVKLVMEGAVYNVLSA